MAINPGPSLVYLTGLSFHLMERPVVALFLPQAVPLIVLPELEGAKIDSLPYAVARLCLWRRPSTWPSVLRQALHRGRAGGSGEGGG